MSDQLDHLKSALAGRYAVERELGAGGMATVYLARDLKHQRLVAIKVLHPELAATLGAVRFVREVSIAANLTHPHILPLHDSGEAGPFLYYVMPYIEGESLRDRLNRQGKLSSTEAARILHQVADALSYAHSQGVVHRDIKPENIMLTGRNAVVADFGIAKAVTEAGNPNQGGTVSELTSVGMVIGTPAYMAPEQALGDPNVDHRVDIYALGVMAYELVTGGQPFKGHSHQEIVAAHVRDTPGPISPDDVPESSALNEVITKCLEKSPDDRWQSVEEFLPQLELSITGERAPFRVRPDATRLVALAAAAIALLAVGLLLLPRFVGNQATTAEAAASVAVLPFSDLSAEGDNEFFTDGLTDELINALSKLEGLRVAGRTSAFWFKDKKDDLKAIGDRLNVRTVLDGSVRRAADRVRVSAQLIDVDDGFEIWSNIYDGELNDIFAVQEDMAQAIAAALELELSEGVEIVESGTDNVDAYNAYLLGRFHWNKRTQQDLRVAASHFEEALALDSSFVDAWSGLADSYVLFPPYGIETPSWQEAISRAESAARTAIAVDSMSAEAHASLAIVLDAQWNWSDAGQEFQSTIALNPQYATAHQWYGIHLLGLERIEEGLAEIRRAEELDPLSSIIGTWVGLTLDVAGQVDEATAQYEKVVELHPGAAHVRRDTWLHYLRAADFGRGSVHLRRYLELTGSQFAERWSEGVRNPDTRMATLQEIAEATAADFKMSTDLRVTLGETDAVLTSLEARLDSPDHLRDSAGAVRAYILSDELRRHPRFQALLEGMQLK